jgi:acetyl/propionyl-CoA carboxylase alpha subunit
MDRFVIEIDNKKISGFALADKNGTWIHVNGETYFVEKNKAGRARKKDESAGGDTFAPMPGKITRVLVKTGDEVTAKQPLVIMEAMKMEYSLRAPVHAKVKSVKCKEGEQVVQDQLLVEFEK